MFDPTWVTISPELPGARVEVSGNAVVVRGATSGNTDYDIFFNAQLTDVYGQTLGVELRSGFAVGAAPRAFAGPVDNFVITDPFADSPGVVYQTVNHDALRVRAWSMSPGQYAEFRQSQNELFGEDWEPGNWPEIIDTEVAVDSDEDSVVETTVDLTDIFARPTDLSRSWSNQQNRSIATIVTIGTIDRSSRGFRTPTSSSMPSPTVTNSWSGRQN